MTKMAKVVAVTILECLRAITRTFCKVRGHRLEELTQQIDCIK